MLSNNEFEAWRPLNSIVRCREKGPRRKQLAVLKPYLLDAPVEALCVRGGFETEIVKLCVAADRKEAWPCSCADGWLVPSAERASRKCRSSVNPAGAFGAAFAAGL